MAVRADAICDTLWLERPAPSEDKEPQRALGLETGESTPATSSGRSSDRIPVDTTTRCDRGGTRAGAAGAVRAARVHSGTQHGVSETALVEAARTRPRGIFYCHWPTATPSSRGSGRVGGAKASGSWSRARSSGLLGVRPDAGRWITAGFGAERATCRGAVAEAPGVLRFHDRAGLLEADPRGAGACPLLYASSFTSPGLTSLAPVALPGTCCQSEIPNVCSKALSRVSAADHEGWWPALRAPFISHASRCVAVERAMFGSSLPAREF